MYIFGSLILRLCHCLTGLMQAPPELRVILFFSLKKFSWSAKLIIQWFISIRARLQWPRQVYIGTHVPCWFIPWDRALLDLDACDGQLFEVCLVCLHCVQVLCLWTLLEDVLEPRHLPALCWTLLEDVLEPRPLPALCWKLLEGVLEPRPLPV